MASRGRRRERSDRRAAAAIAAAASKPVVRTVSTCRVQARSRSRCRRRSGVEGVGGDDLMSRRRRRPRRAAPPRAATFCPTRRRPERRCGCSLRPGRDLRGDGRPGRARRRAPRRAAPWRRRRPRRPAPPAGAVAGHQRDLAAARGGGDGVQPRPAALRSLRVVFGDQTRAAAISDYLELASEFGDQRRDVGHLDAGALRLAARRP